jgi:hypothetical protein
MKVIAGERGTRMQKRGQVWATIMNEFERIYHHPILNHAHTSFLYPANIVHSHKLEEDYACNVRIPLPNTNSEMAFSSLCQFDSDSSPT